MDWALIGKIADITGILGFFISLGIIQRIYYKTETQKGTYIQERKDLLNNLHVLQQNIWDDGLTSEQLQDNLQTKMFEYQLKFLLISSPRCIFHAFRCTHLLKKGINKSNTTKIRQDINFLIARLSKKE